MSKKEVKLLKDYDYDYILQQYKEKNESLSEVGEEVNPWQFYEDIFGSLNLVSPAVDKVNNKILQMRLEDLLDHAMGQEGIFLSACTFFKNYYNSKGLMDVYAFVVDLDSVWSGGLDAVLKNKWQNNSKGNFHVPPTYIVNSGTGLHLYFVLDKPVPLFSKQAQVVKDLYRKMAIHQSLRPFVGAKPEVHWVGQTFRMPGTLSKQGLHVRAYKIAYGRKYTIQELAKLYGVKYKFQERGQHEDYPDFEPRKKKKNTGKGWHTNRAFYDYCVRMIPEKTQQGHRYMTMCALAAIAFKCGVSKDELEITLRSFLPDWNKGKVGEARVERWEVRSAMKMYSKEAFKMRRSVIEDYFGWEFRPIKRNGRKRPQHIQIMNTMKSLKKQMGETVNEGRPTHENKVTAYRRKHPDANKSEVARALGLSRPTVHKWWDAKMDEPNEENVLQDFVFVDNKWETLNLDEFEIEEGKVEFFSTQKLK